MAFPLHPEIPEEGMPLEQLFAGRLMDLDQVLARLRDTARSVGLPFGDRRMTYNSRLAQELAKWAEEQGRGEAFHRSVFGAYFAEGKNIGQADVLIDLVRGLGLPSKEAAAILEDRPYREAVDADWVRSRQMGIQAVPTLALQGSLLVGAQPYEKMADLVRSAQVNINDA